jgi:hypothetical protein
MRQFNDVKEKINEHVAKYDDKMKITEFHNRLQRVEFEDASRNIHAAATSNQRSDDISVSLSETNKSFILDRSIPLSMDNSVSTTPKAAKLNFNNSEADGFKNAKFRSRNADTVLSRDSSKEITSGHIDNIIQ